MKKKIIMLYFFALFIVVPPNSNASGIPVLDGASIAQEATNFIKTIAHYQSELMQMKQQFEQQVKELEAMSNPRGMSSAINSIYDKNMKANTKAVFNDYGILESSELEINDQQTANDFDKSNERAAEWLTRVDKFQEQTIDRFDELQQLVTKIDTTKDPKDIWDLQARIQAEQVLLSNESLKMMLVYQEAQAKKDMEEQNLLQQHLEMTQQKPRITIR